MQKRTVLVVDDDDRFRESVVDVLNDWTSDLYAVGTSDGYHALDFIEKHEVHALVTDLQMPILSGVDFLREILNRNILVPVVVMTDSSTAGIEGWATMQPAFALFEKPVNVAKLLDAVERVMTERASGYGRGVTLPIICHLIGHERETCEVRVRSGTHAGYLIFREGTLEGAVHCDATGDQVARDMLTWERPMVEILRRIPVRARTVTASLLDLGGEQPAVSTNAFPEQTDPTQIHEPGTPAGEVATSDRADVSAERSPRNTHR